MLWSTITVLVALVPAVVALPDTHVVHERRDVTSARWVKRGRVRPEAILPIRIGMTQRNLDKGHEFLMDVSHPASPNYGKHWSIDQVIETFQPESETVAAVYTWLLESGIEAGRITHSANKAWLAFRASAKEMESLLHTTYHEYEDRRTGGVMPSCEAYHLPKDLRKHIDYITPGIRLLAPSDELTANGRDTLDKRSWPHAPGSGQKPPGGTWHHPQPKKWRPGGSWPWPAPYGGANDSEDLSTCDIAITPACVAALYQIPPADPRKVNPSNSMGIFEAELQYWDQLDLNLFFTNYTKIPNGTHPSDNDVDGGVAETTNITEAGGEAMLDLQVSSVSR